jgi:hypothetical protein
LYKKLKQILSSITFFPENRAIYEIMWKNAIQFSQATDGGKAHAHSMLDN